MAQHDYTSALVRTWQLVTTDVRYSDGEIVYPWGRDATGYLMYSADGHMSAVISRRERPAFSVPDLLDGSTEELVQAARTYLSYGGSYEVNGDVVTHHVNFSLFPNWIGQDQLRFIDTLSEECLILRTPPMLLGNRQGVGYITWK